MAGFSIGWCDANKREFISNFVQPDLQELRFYVFDDSFSV